MRGLLEVLVVVDAEHGPIAGAQPADLGLKVTSGSVAHDRQDREAVDVRHADARVEPADLRVVPRNREENWGVQQVAEVVSVVRVLPEIVAINDQVPAKRLLKSTISSEPFPPVIHV